MIATVQHAAVWGQPSLHLPVAVAARWVASVAAVCVCVRCVGARQVAVLIRRIGTIRLPPPVEKGLTLSASSTAHMLACTAARDDAPMLRGPKPPPSTPPTRRNHQRKDETCTIHQCLGEQWYTLTCVLRPMPRLALVYNGLTSVQHVHSPSDSLVHCNTANRHPAPPARNPLAMRVARVYESAVARLAVRCCVATATPSRLQRGDVVSTKTVNSSNLRVVAPQGLLD